MASALAAHILSIRQADDDQPDTPEDRARKSENISINSFLAALAVAIIIFAVQIFVFLCLRNKLARIFKPRTYLVPERERTDSPPANPVALIKRLWLFGDRDIIRKCGLDAYFFLRYLRTLLLIFVPIACVTFVILLPINYRSGESRDLMEDGGNDPNQIAGLDTLAWGNVSREYQKRTWAHLVIAYAVIAWVCCVMFFEFKIFVKIRQDYLTSAEHRLRASATTILVNNVPPKWLTNEALRGLFDIFPGGIRNVWLNRDLSALLEKIEQRDDIYKQLEAAETELIRNAKKKQLKQRKKEEKAARKENKSGAPTKEDQERRRKQEDAAAIEMARAGHGLSTGNEEEVPHNVTEAVDEIQHDHEEELRARQSQDSQHRGFGGVIGGGFNKFGHGLRTGAGKAGQGFKHIGHDFENGVNTTNGFTRIGSRGDTDEAPSSAYPRESVDHPRVQALKDDGSERPATASSLNSNGARLAVPPETRSTHSRDHSVGSQLSGSVKFDTTNNGNTVRQVSDLNKLIDNDRRKWYQFWRAPAGGYASPVPQKAEVTEEDTFQKNRPPRPWWKVLLSVIGLGGHDLAEMEYEQATNTGKDYTSEDDNDADAEWRKYVKPKNRPTHRLPRWGFPNWLAWLTFGKKVDTIYWCRTELARLNLEIKTDQAHPERYPLMNSAFIQFNDQVSAHLASQGLVHHLPKQMAPRLNEVSPRDVIWGNMAMKWWDEWARTAFVFALICTMIIFWTVPVAWTAAIANIDGLTQEVSWLHWIRDNDTVYKAAGAVAGVLPPALLALLLILVPLILDLLADFKGAKTHSQKTEFVQRFFFVFLFVQVFLVVTVASFFASSVDTLFANLSDFRDISKIWDILARNLPSAANYFFSYMLLQAMSASSGALLQIGALIAWYIIAKMFDSTARSKWARNTKLNNIKWGHLFPVYTNFAVIALIYSVVAPLISLFAIITFSLLWAAQKYCLLYVVRAEVDTGGLLYPRALNQTFTGLYVMELCLAGLFFILRDDQNQSVGETRGALMLVAVPLTALFQSLLNRSFSPLFRYLPITMEDEAAIRDRAFEKEQRRRLGIADESELEEDEKAQPSPMDSSFATKDDDDEIELRGMERSTSKKLKFNPVRDVGNIAKRGGKGLKDITWNKLEAPSAVKNAAAYRQHQRQKDLEAQRAIGDALYGGVADDIEDLMPEERNALVMEAFKHRALRARQPTIWIPRDDIGVSDAEIKLTKAYSENISISNEGTALDSKVRVVYGRNPPDFSEVDLIDL